MDSNFVCPVCQYVLPSNMSICPNCEEDVTALAHVHLRAQIAYNEGLRQAQAGKLDSAIMWLQQATQIAPDNVRALVVLGKLYAQQARFTQAHHIWEHVLQLEPSNHAAQAGLSQLVEIKREAQQNTYSRSLQRRVLLAGAFLTGILVIWLSQLFGVAPSSMNTNIRSISDLGPLPTLIATFTPVTPLPTLTPLLTPSSER